MDLLRAQAKGQEFDEAKARDKIEAQLEREMVSDMTTARERGLMNFTEEHARPVRFQRSHRRRGADR